MSVTTELILPNQPGANRTVINTPLGGDGYRSPLSSYSVEIESTGDASGGVHDIRVTPDPQYISVISYVCLTQESQNSDEDARLSIVPEDGAPVTVFGTIEYRNVGTTSGTRGSLLWMPPPILLAPNVRVELGAAPRLGIRLANVNNQTIALYSRFYNFAKDAREKIPSEVLFRVLQRASSLF